MRITCYGGVREIGGNKVLIEDSGSVLLLDFGLPMGRASEFLDMFVQLRTQSHLLDAIRLGIAPTLDGLYRHDLLKNDELIERALAHGVPEEELRWYASEVQSYAEFLQQNGRPRANAVLISHAHLDHVGQVGYLDEGIPIACTPVCKTILEAIDALALPRTDSRTLSVQRRSIRRRTNLSKFPGAPYIYQETVERPVIQMEEYAETVIAGFRVRPLPVDHSLPGCCATLILTPSGKKVLYSGDLRFNGRWSLGRRSLTERLRVETKDLRPDVLLTEGTRIKSTSRDDENAVRSKLKEVVEGSSGIVFVDWAWKDIARFQTIAEVAKETGRILAANPKAVFLYKTLTERYPHLFPAIEDLGPVRVYVERAGSMTYSPDDYKPYELGPFTEWPEEWIPRIKEEWEEPGSPEVRRALEWYYGGARAYEIRRNPSRYIVQLGFYQIQELIDLEPPPGSVYVKCATEPFSDEMRIDEQRLRAWLTRFGVESRGEEEDSLLRAHISGHASGADLLEWIADMRPSLVIPIHTTRPEEFEGKVGEEVVYVEEGKPIEL
jgi:ribonuclease J